MRIKKAPACKVGNQGSRLPPLSRSRHPKRETQIAEAVTKLRTVASTGPVIEFESADGTIHLGDTITLLGGAVLRLRVAVWAPAWMAIDRVKLIENGSVREQWDGTTQPAVTAPGPGGSAPWFEHEVQLTPDHGGWYAVEVEGDADLAPVLPDVVPWAHTAPIFVELASPVFERRHHPRNADGG